MTIDTKLISQLRNQTGAGISDCKKALEESGGDIDKAMDVLRKKGEIKAAKKSAQRDTKDGLVQSYIHANGKMGSLVALACETDFVAKTDDFKNLVADLAMHIAASNPLFLTPQDIPENILNKEKEIYKEQLAQEGKPAEIVDKIIEGKLNKYYEEVCLLNQPYIKDEDKKISDLINETIAKTGEKIEIKHFARFEV